MKVVIFLLFLSMSFFANANWTPIAESDEGSVTSIDYSTLTKSGNLAKVWVITVYKISIPTSKGQMKSTKTYVEVDCREKKSRDLSSVYYSDEQEKNIIHTSKVSDWIYYPPGSVGDTTIKVTCGR